VKDSEREAKESGKRYSYTVKEKCKKAKESRKSTKRYSYSDETGNEKEIG